MKNRIYIAILALVFFSCEPEFDTPVESAVYTSGTVDFSNYVALGNSLTAGYADGALYRTGQENSYPNIMAQQFAFANGGEFTQPLMEDNTGGALLSGTQILENRFVLEAQVTGEGTPDDPAFSPKRLVATPTTEISSVLSGGFNNMGVPGAKSFHLLAPGYGNVAGVAAELSNPYFARFASSATASVIGDAVAQNPTFFSLWIGNNDILSYATSGGIGVDHNDTGNIDPSTYESNDITNTMAFAGVYSQLVAALTANGAKGILLNLPDVTSLPFFTTVPYAPLSPLDPTFGPQIPTLNTTFAGLNGAFAFAGFPERAITFSTTGASAVLIKDESLTDISAALVPILTPTFGVGLAMIYAGQYGQVRQATAEDLILLPSSSIIGQLDVDKVAELVGMGLTQEQAGQLAVQGVTLPLGDMYVLTPEEQAAITAAQTAYNTTIQGLATANNLAFLDVKSILAQAANGGLPFDGGLITSQFVSGGGFSLDGVHPTPRAHALLTNELLDAIETEYMATVPRVNPGTYGTVTLSNDVN